MKINLKDSYLLKYTRSNHQRFPVLLFALTAMDSSQTGHIIEPLCKYRQYRQLCTLRATNGTSASAMFGGWSPVCCGAMLHQPDEPLW